MRLTPGLAFLALAAAPAVHPAPAAPPASARGCALTTLDGAPAGPLRGPAAVEVVFVVAAERRCDVCLSEVASFADYTRSLGLGPEVLSVVVLVVGSGAVDPATLRGRLGGLPTGARVALDAEGRCWPEATGLVRRGLQPVKLILDAERSLVGLDYCAELDQEREAFRALVRKAIRRFHSMPLHEARPAPRPPGASSRR